MASLCNEIRIVFTGPQSRFFVAYKPQGWFLTAPFDRKLGEGVLAPVLAAKLGVPVNAITFPSKLTVQERGLIIGCTDASMHQTISRILKNGSCTKSYQCIVHANNATSSKVIRDSIFKHAYMCFNHRTDVSSGVVQFDLLEHEKIEPLKKLGNIIDSQLRSGLSQFIARGRSISALNARLRKKKIPRTDDLGVVEEGHSTDDGSSMNFAETNSQETSSSDQSMPVNAQLGDDKVMTKGHSIAFVMENLQGYLQRFGGPHDDMHNNTKRGQMDIRTHLGKDRCKGMFARFRHMELATSSHVVNRHLVEILSSLGLVVLTGHAKERNANLKATEGSLCLELCGIQFPHPIYKHRVVEALVHEDNPEVPRDWIQHVVTVSSD